MLYLLEEDCDVVFSWRKYRYSQIIGIKIYLDWYYKICMLRLSMKNIFSTWSWETNIIIGSVRLIECSRRANILLLDVMKFIDHALFSIKFQRNLLSFIDIRWNGYHTETKKREEFCVTTIISDEEIYIGKVVSLFLWLLESVHQKCTT